MPKLKLLQRKNFQSTSQPNRRRKGRKLKNWKEFSQYVWTTLFPGGIQMTNLSHPVILKFRNHQVCCYVVVSWIYLHCIEKYLHCIEKFKILTLVLVNDYITTCSFTNWDFPQWNAWTKTGLSFWYKWQGFHTCTV